MVVDFGLLPWQFLTYLITYALSQPREFRQYGLPNFKKLETKFKNTFVGDSAYMHCCSFI
jgi:hypothetical protein